MNDSHQAYRELLPALALGALEDAERTALEGHLAGCAECRSELRSWEAEALALVAAEPAIDPSPLSRQRLLRALPAVAAVAVGAPASRAAASGRLLAAAALVLAVLASAASWLTVRRAADRADAAVVAERAIAGERLAALGRELAALRDERDALAVAVRAIAAPELQLVRLGGLGGRQASGRTFVDPAGGRAVFTAFGLPPAPPGKTYELWTIAGGTPSPVGTFDVGQDGVGVLAVPALPASAVEVWAVTVEPQGGVPLPTGEMVLASVTG